MHREWPWVSDLVDVWIEQAVGYTGLGFTGEPGQEMQRKGLSA